jgi:hypothetical protein
MEEASQIVINQDMLVMIMISVTGALLSSLVAVTFFAGRMILNRLDVKIDSCHLQLAEDIKEAKSGVSHVHNRMTDHVEKYHTTRDK